MGGSRSLMSPTAMTGSTPALCQIPICQSVLSWKYSVSDTHMLRDIVTLGNFIYYLYLLQLVSALYRLLSSADRTVILSPPQALKVQAGERAIFTCLSLADPRLDPPFIQWRKNNQKLADSNNDKKWDIFISENKEDNFGNHKRMIMLVSNLLIGVGNEG